MRISPTQQLALLSRWQVFHPSLTGWVQFSGPVGMVGLVGREIQIKNPESKLAQRLLPPTTGYHARGLIAKCHNNTTMD